MLLGSFGVHSSSSILNLSFAYGNPHSDTTLNAIGFVTLRFRVAYLFDLELPDTGLKLWQRNAY